MTREEAEEYADKMSYRDAVSNALKGKGIPFRKATLTKLHRLLNIIEPMEKEEDAISRAEAIRIASGYCHWTNIPDELAKLPSVTPKQKIGHWINGECNCPVCGEDKYKDLDADVWSDWQPKFCPNCGANMSENPTSSNCTACILDGTDACSRGAGRAVDGRVCEDFVGESEEG